MADKHLFPPRISLALPPWRDACAVSLGGMHDLERRVSSLLDRVETGR